MRQQLPGPHVCSHVPGPHLCSQSHITRWAAGGDLPASAKHGAKTSPSLLQLRPPLHSFLSLLVVFSLISCCSINEQEQPIPMARQMSSVAALPQEAMGGGSLEFPVGTRPSVPRTSHQRGAKAAKCTSHSLGTFGFSQSSTPCMQGQAKHQVLSPGPQYVQVLGLVSPQNSEQLLTPEPPS